MKNTMISIFNSVSLLIIDSGGLWVNDEIDRLRDVKKQEDPD
jgi:hypothetical protein